MNHGSSIRDAKKKIRGTIFLLSFIFIILSGGHEIFWKEKERAIRNTPETKTITVIDGGLELRFTGVIEKTVGAFLASEKLSLDEGESVVPDETVRLFSGTTIRIARAHEVSVKADEQELRLRTQALSVDQALTEAGIKLDPDDIVEPPLSTLVTDGTQVTVTRVTVREELIEKPIAFPRQSKEDAALSWRQNNVTQPGETGMERLTYQVSLYDGREVKRALLRRETIKEPVAEITTRGTYVKTGKSYQGAASWYAYTGTLSAANPWLPIGSYVRVTNVANGKSVIVRINDRGPFAPGRIIDLDKAAFIQIASLGQGVIGVTMEEIIN